jgi:Mrp family chromosome partitioning ATPase
MLDGARPPDTAVRADRNYQLKRTGLSRLDLATCRAFSNEESADRLAEIETLMAQYQVVVVDLGVVRLDAAGLVLARAEDPILLVARCGYTERSQLSTTVDALTAANRSIGGVILNGRVNPIPRWVRKALLGRGRNEV